MTKIAESKPDKSIVEAVEGLRDLGFNPVALASERSNLKRLRVFSPKEVQKVQEVLLGVSSGYYKRLKGSGKAYVNKSEYGGFIRKASYEKLAKVLRTLAILTQTKVYLLWKKQPRQTTLGNNTKHIRNQQDENKAILAPAW